MHAENMVGNFTIPCFVDVIRDNEEKIKTRQERVGKSDVLMWVLVYIILWSIII